MAKRLSGSPRVWKSKLMPYSAPPEKWLKAKSLGPFFPDLPNPDLRPSLLPLFSAVDSLNVLDWPSVDFVTDRHALMTLLGWANRDENNFRINVQLAGLRTVMFSPWGHEASDPMDRDPGFEWVSTWSPGGLGGQTGYSHYRIVHFVGLNQ